MTATTDITGRFISSGELLLAGFDVTITDARAVKICQGLPSV